jgi:diaminopimelate epimerase
MQRIPYWKYEGAGNDFVALDARDGLPELETALIREVCDRRLGIGADGVLVIEPAAESGIHFRMVYYNADGSRGEMCGNGARCIAAFALLRGAAPASMRFLTDAGTYSAQVREDAISVAFPDIRETVVEKRAITEGRAWEGDYLPVGVPHFVTWVNDLDRVDVARIGRALRHHEAFAPRGTNVNFAQILGPASLRLRTYERGVEAETLACGTGSVATALTYALRQGVLGPHRISLLTASGQLLGVSFVLDDSGATDVSLHGPARLVHEGTWLRP